VAQTHILHYKPSTPDCVIC